MALDIKLLDPISMKLIQNILYETISKLESKKYRRSMPIKVVETKQYRNMSDPSASIKVWRKDSSGNYGEKVLSIQIHNHYYNYNTLFDITERRDHHIQYHFDKGFIEKYDEYLKGFSKSARKETLNTSPNFIRFYNKHFNLPIFNAAMANPNEYIVMDIHVNCYMNRVAYNLTAGLFNDKPMWELPDISYYQRNRYNFRVIGDRWTALVPIAILSDASKPFSDIIRASTIFGIQGLNDYFNYYEYYKNKFRMLTNLQKLLKDVSGPNDAYSNLIHTYSNINRV